PRWKRESSHQAGYLLFLRSWFLRSSLQRFHLQLVLQPVGFAPAQLLPGLVPVLLQRRVSLMPCLVLLPELIPPAGAEVLQKPAIQEVLLQQGSLQRRLVLFPGQ